MRSTIAKMPAMNGRTTVACVLLWSSMVLLYPGITGDLLHYRVNYRIDWLGRTLNVKEETRSLWGSDYGKSIIGALMFHHAEWAACGLVFFGCCIPLFKLCAFHAWLLGKPGSMTNKMSEKAISFLGSSARWVAVDAVCEAMFVGMLLKIPAVQADHKAAFLSFVVYCIMSATAFLLIDTHQEERTVSPTKLSIGRFMRKSPALVVVTMLTFLALFYMGATQPCMRVMIPENVMRDAAMKEIKNMKDLGESRGLKALEAHLVDEIATKVKIDEDISVTGCARRLLNSGVLYSMIGSAILFTCVLLIPLMDAVLGTVGAMNAEYVPAIKRYRAFLNHFTMLDVMIVGFILGVLTTKCEPSIKAVLLPPFMYLFFAALVMYAHSYLCDAAADAVETKKAPVLDSVRAEENNGLLTENKAELLL